MPIVCYKLEDGTYEIVDGFHRCQTMKDYRDIYEREGGMMPPAVIDKLFGNRMASSIRHNRARRSHNIEFMTNIVRELTEAACRMRGYLKTSGWMRRSCCASSRSAVLPPCSRRVNSAGHGNRRKAATGIREQEYSLNSFSYRGKRVMQTVPCIGW